MVVWSQRILDELTSSLLKRRPDLGAPRLEHLVSELRRAFPNATIEGYDHLIPTMLNDDKDRHVLAAAAFARANVLVTWNTKDFPEGSAAPHNVTVRTPDEFLCDLWEGNQVQFVEILRRQSAGTHEPALTVGEILGRLMLRVPNFAELAAQHMAEA